jgi:uncharacterized membrane protein YkvA (DUF1232 family)
VLERLKSWAKLLKAQLALLAFAMRDPRTPVIAKLVAGLTVAYALSPIDLIPDFVPVLGLLDDLILLPLGIWVALRLIPASLRFELAHQPMDGTIGKPSPFVAMIIVMIWIAAAIFMWHGLGLSNNPQAIPA